MYVYFKYFKCIFIYKNMRMYHALNFTVCFLFYFIFLSREKTVQGYLLLYLFFEVQKVQNFFSFNFSLKKKIHIYWETS